jgi:hypothetical protein
LKNTKLKLKKIRKKIKEKNLNQLELLNLSNKVLLGELLLSPPELVDLSAELPPLLPLQII